MNGAWAFGRGVARYSARKRELFKQRLEASFILADLRVHLAVAAFEIGVGHHRRATVTGARNEDHVEIKFFDDPIQMCVNKVLPRCGAPMPKQHAFHVLKFQRLAQQRVVAQIHLAD